jgi:hypothetical protein
MSDLFSWAIARGGDKATSQIAAREVQPKLGRLRLAFMSSLGELRQGTANEVAKYSGWTTTESVRKRAKELVQSGLIVECGVRPCIITGKMATVYKIKEYA